jgi:hypothetical protein
MKNPNSNDNFLKDEYEEYRKSLELVKECAACHYLQGMIFTFIAGFTGLRFGFLYQSLNKMEILKYSSIFMFFALTGVYKFSYAYYVNKVQTNAKKLKNFNRE